jgi:hypothetical protein
MPLSFTTILLLSDSPPHFDSPSSTPRKPPRTSKPDTLPRPNRRPRTTQHARSKSTRRHLNKPTSSQFAGKRRDLRRQTHRHGTITITITVLGGSERRRRSSQVSRIKSERRNSAWCWDWPEAARSPGARGRAHVAWCSRGVGCGVGGRETLFGGGACGGAGS